LSSSTLKTLLKDPAKFYREWFLNEDTSRSASFFDEGSYVHSLVLEPHKVASEYAFFEGMRKAGKAFQEFKEQNEGKIILTTVQQARAYKFYEAVQARAEAVRMLSGGIAEHTIQSKILGVDVKARPDYINVDAGYIVDLKTTSYPSTIDVFKHTLKEYYYDLSAALYCQIAHDVYGKLFDFYFVVVSKSDLTCDIYKASSNTLSEGSALVTKAIVLFKRCSETGVWSHENKPNFDSKNMEILEV
jgi:hypothetical protein